MQYSVCGGAFVPGNKRHVESKSIGLVGKFKAKGNSHRQRCLLVIVAVASYRPSATRSHAKHIINSPPSPQCVQESCHFIVAVESLAVQPHGSPWRVRHDVAQGVSGRPSRTPGVVLGGSNAGEWLPDGEGSSSIRELPPRRRDRRGGAGVTEASV